MSDFFGSRISLISKSDIRYVGTLHEINSESSTVALEQVTSFGTEGRRNNPEEEVAPNSTVYEYIVFRGSDVKDLRIEEAPKENRPPSPPQVPNDPAILGAGSRPPTHPGQPPLRQPPQGPQSQQHPPHFQQPPPFPYQQYNQYPQQRYGGPQGGPGHNFQGPPGGFQGYPGMPYGPPPPGWFPPGQGYPQPPGPFPPRHQMQPFGAPPHQSGQPGPPQPQQQRGPAQPQAPPGLSQRNPPPASANEDQKPVVVLPAGTKEEMPTTPISEAAPGAGPPPPVESKPDVAAALAAPVTQGQSATTVATPAKPHPSSSKSQSGRIIPAIPFASPKVMSQGASKASTLATRQNQTQAPPSNPTSSQLPASKPGQAAANAALQYQNATQAATAAVAAAMAKLPSIGGTKQQTSFQLGAGGDAMDNLTRKVNEMRTDDRIRHGKQSGTGGYAAGNRGAASRGGTRRGGRELNKGLEVPTTDFDFATANAQFNKVDALKEAIASGSPLGSPTNGEVRPTGSAMNGDGVAEVVIPAATGPLYNKSSFFDNISSEAKDREDTAVGNVRASGQEFRSQERQRNMETFGLGSVDGGRGEYRGRGRGRGGFRQGYGRGAGGPRGRGKGERGDAAFGAAYAATAGTQ